MSLTKWFTTDTLVTSSSSPVICSQASIGFRLLTRGFLSRKWRQLWLEDHATGTQHEAPCRPETHDHSATIFIAGLIKICWTSLSQLWLDHLATIHNTIKTTQSPVTLQSLRARSRLIHGLKPATLPIHSQYQSHRKPKPY